MRDECGVRSAPAIVAPNPGSRWPARSIWLRRKLWRATGRHGRRKTCEQDHVQRWHHDRIRPTGCWARRGHHWRRPDRPQRQRAGRAAGGQLLHRRQLRPPRPRPKRRQPAVQRRREYDDLAAVIDAAGGATMLYGISLGGALALEAAARGPPVTKLAVWEPPYYLDDEPRRPQPTTRPACRRGRRLPSPAARCWCLRCSCGEHAVTTSTPCEDRNPPRPP